MLPALHFLHVLAGATWLGGSLALLAGVYPALLRMDAAEARAVWNRLAPGLGAAIGAAAGLTMLLGLARAWAGGGVTAWSDLGSAYALWVLAALALAIANGALGGAMRGRFEALLDDPSGYAAGARGAVRAILLVEAGTLGAILVIMVKLGLGYY